MRPPLLTAGANDRRTRPPLETTGAGFLVRAADVLVATDGLVTGCRRAG